MNNHTSAKTPEDLSRVFWRDALAIRESLTSRVGLRTLMFAAIAALVCAVNDLLTHVDLGIDVAPYEVAGAALGLLLVLRTNAGYDRWWEARRLWGGITNQSRNLAIGACAYGPPDAPDWRDALVRWTAALAHVIRHSLRGERDLPQVTALLGAEETARIAAAEHMPTYASLRIAALLREGYERFGMDRFAFLKAEESRALLVDHLGGCERILKTPLPRAYTIMIRWFILLFLSTMPFALLPRVGWLTPLETLVVAYVTFALDDIGAELQNPFDVRNIGHLPLDTICATIEGNLLALIGAKPKPFAESADALDPLA